MSPVGTLELPTSAARVPRLTRAISGPGVRRKLKRTPYLQLLMALLRPHGIPDPMPEYLFHPTRKWRFDFAWCAPVKLAIEIDGGLFVNGGHNRGAALLAQYEKQNAAVLLNWRVLRYSPEHLAEAARDVRQVFDR